MLTSVSVPGDFTDLSHHGLCFLLLDTPDNLGLDARLFLAGCWAFFIPVLELCSGKQLRYLGTVWSFQVLLL